MITTIQIQGIMKVSEEFTEKKQWEYYTPYEVTVFYYEKDYIPSCLARLHARAQRIPLPESADLIEAIAVPEFISPRVVVFGNIFDEVLLNTLLDRGFQSVHVLGVKPIINDAISDVTAVENENIHYFSIDDIFNHYNILTPIRLVLAEYLIRFKWPRFTPALIPDVPLSASAHLVQAIKIEGYGALGLVNNMRGFDELDKLVARGQAYCAARERATDQSLERAFVYTPDVPNNISPRGPTGKILYVAGGHIRELRELALVHPNTIRNAARTVVSYKINGILITLRIFTTEASLELMHTRQDGYYKMYAILDNKGASLYLCDDKPSALPPILSTEVFANNISKYDTYIPPFLRR